MRADLSADGRPRVVVVDDDETQLCLVELFLDEDHVVVCFSDPEQALVSILACPPDVVLSDIYMPRLDGADLRAKVMAAGLQIPFGFMSGNDPQGELSVADDRSPVIGLQKPVDRERLRAAVASLLQRGASRTPGG